MRKVVQMVIEIAPAADGSVPEALVVQAFLDSLRERVVLVLNGVDVPLINRILDPVARDAPMSMPGVLYVGIADERRIGEALAGARAVVAATEEFRALVLRLGYALGPSPAPPAVEPPPLLAMTRAAGEAGAEGLAAAP